MVVIKKVLGNVKLLLETTKPLLDRLKANKVLVKLDGAGHEVVYL